MHSLAGSWRVCNEMERPLSDASQYAQPGLEDQNWHEIQLPAPWERLGLTDATANWWYRRRFSADGTADRVAIFGVPGDARVYLNGTLLEGEVSTRKLVAALPPGLSGKQVLAICLPNCNGPSARLGAVGLLTPGESASLPLAGETARSSVDWVRDAVIYECYPRSFSDAGDLNAITEQLPRLQELGTSVLWLMPIHPIGVEKKKGSLGCPYSIRDFNTVAPELGTLDDLKRLKDACHERGIKLIIDLVANHTSWDHEWITAHPNWYEHKDDGTIRCPVDDWTDIAQLDYRNQDLRAEMLRMMQYWVDEVGLDGFRCDVAGMVPQDFWDDARPKLEANKPIIMLAEDDGPAQHRVAFDLTYDWHLYDLLGALANGGVRAEWIRDLLDDEQQIYPQGSLRMRFSTNHDKNAWDEPAITRYGSSAKARLATALTYALPGVPLIYNGQELGNHNKLDLFEKVGFEYAYEHNAGYLIDMYAFLHEHRTAHPAFGRGEVTVHVDPSAPFVAIIENKLGDDRTWTVLNLGAEPATPKRPSGLNAAQGVYFFEDNGQSPIEHTTAETAPETLPPYSAWFGA